MQKRPNPYTHEIEATVLAYAGFWIRLAAYFFDSMVVSFIKTILFSWIHFDTNPMGMTLKTSLSVLILLAYFGLMTYFCQGQTLGKMVFRIRVVSTDFQPLSWQQVLTREIAGRYILQRLKILYLIVAFTPDKLSLADYLADTRVVKEDVYQAMIH